MDLVATAQAAQAVAATELATVDWRSIAIMAGAIIGATLTFIMAVCGWVWISTMAWLRRISDDFAQHVRDDSQAFAEVTRTINSNHIATITAINQARNQRYDDDRSHG